MSQRTLVITTWKIYICYKAKGDERIQTQRNFQFQFLYESVEMEILSICVELNFV
jgi:hypothetical protein